MRVTYYKDATKKEQDEVDKVQKELNDKLVELSADFEGLKAQHVKLVQVHIVRVVKL